MNAARTILVFFAVEEEARPFRRLAHGRAGLQVHVTGMGRTHAERVGRETLDAHPAKLVLTCGFAGGLKPEFASGTVLFSADAAPGLEPALRQAGAHAATFCCAPRVATTAREKRALRESTGADAVEMESEVIRALCRERGVPGATVRVILDPANQDLPLDFNALMTADQQMNYVRLARELMRSPAKVPALLKMRQTSAAAAVALAKVLARTLEHWPG